MLEGSAVHEFHGDKRPAVLLADLVDRADMGMIQRGCRTRLPPKAFQSLWVLREVFGEKFERDKPAEGWILGFVNNTHAAAAQLFDDSIVRDGLADHWASAWSRSRSLRWASGVHRIATLLFGIEKPNELRFQFGVVTAGRVDEISAVLRALLQGGMEQRLQALPEFRSHTCGTPATKWLTVQQVSHYVMEMPTG